MKAIIPQRSGYWKNNYVTYRRLWLDASLAAFANEMRGVVLDLGGKRENKRGTFQPPEEQARAWWYLNLDLSTNPNIFADVTRVPLMAQSVDSILCTEVLEHLPNPQACVDEIHRLLSTGGVALASVPFFYPVHADPYDFQRFTEDGLRQLFRNFKSVEVHRMGGYAGVLGLMLEIGISGVEGNSLPKKFTRWAMKWISRWLCRYDLAIFGRESNAWSKFTTGYFLRAVR
jgi:SAM-dependent methyltransferase